MLASRRVLGARIELGALLAVLAVLLESFLLPLEHESGLLIIKCSNKRHLMKHAAMRYFFTHTVPLLSVSRTFPYDNVDIRVVTVYCLVIVDRRSAPLTVLGQRQ